MRIHREGRPLLAALAGILFAINTAAFRLLPRPLFAWTAVLSAVVFGFFARFFRDPLRVTPTAPGSIIAPADGTIVALERVCEPEFFGDERLKISIYMNALNVHLNRVPVSGVVKYTKYHPGKYLVAFHPKASELNERNTCVIETADGQQLLVRQIAGILARRIVFYPRVGEQITAGDELGFIKLGSRCDVFLPADCRVHVQLQDKVKGGETILAEWTQK
jgi:phosphatidylserine decarboxylase